MSDLDDKISTLKHREERLKIAQEALRSLGEQRIEAIRVGDTQRAAAMDVSLESHRADIIRLPALIEKLRGKLDRDHPGWRSAP